MFKISFGGTITVIRYFGTKNFWIETLFLFKKSKGTLMFSIILE